MSEIVESIAKICRTFDADRCKLLDMLRAVQKRYSYVPQEAVDALASALGVPRIEIESVVSFYDFLAEQPKGRIVIRLSNDIVDEMFGVARVAAAFERELGIRFGETTPDGLVSLEYTSCIGMSDQAPAALVNDTVVTYLSSDKVRDIVQIVRQNANLKKLVTRVGDGNNAHPLIHAMVHNGIRKAGPVVLALLKKGAALRKALAMSPVEVIKAVKNARLRGRGGSGGFPAGMKWEFTRNADQPDKVFIANAGEGDPGSFKDRVLLTEYADLLLEGMTIGAYAIGATTGLLYLRGEYAYLREYLENVLNLRREQGLLGRNILGRNGFDFDVEIRMGAGAYVCGEETALLNACEGRRAEPRLRPPFPAQHGYQGRPTCVNNIETLCCAARIMEQGSAWFVEMGTRGSSGTKLISVSGDCSRPGVYEVPFGVTLEEILHDVGAEDAAAVQMGGPSGEMLAPGSFGRKLCFDDLATGGSVIVFNASRRPLDIAERFMAFFVRESCGFCTPCRMGVKLMHDKMRDLAEGRGETTDLTALEQLGRTIRHTSMCGLGQNAPNPVLSTLENFRSEYDALIKTSDGLRPGFDPARATREARRLLNRSGD